MAAGLCLFAPAKVNLALAVGPRRGDGYHGVRTVLQTVCLHDRIDLEPRAGEILVECDDPAAGEGPDNLAWRAAEALRVAAGTRAGLRIVLHKRIPVRAGLGGASSDAAAVLVGCNRLWALGWDRTRLATVARGLGADVPFFLYGGTALAAGRGDEIAPLPELPPWPLVLCRPQGPGIATPAAYSALDEARPAPSGPEGVDVDGLCAACSKAGGDPAALRRRIAAMLANSFEPIILSQRPDIAAARATLLQRGALGALLCGSGSAVFAVAPTGAWARDTATALRGAGLWARTTHLFAPRASAGRAGNSREEG